MEIGLNLVSALALVVGSVLFLVGAFMPISARVYPEADPAKKLAHITDSPNAWVASQILLGIGSLITVIGIALLAYHLRDESFAWFMWSSAGVLALSLVPWGRHLFGRIVDPATFAEGGVPRLFLLYAALTEVGLAIFGVGLVSSGYPVWLGWVVVVGMMVLIVLTIVFGDIFPLLFYLFTLSAGVVILLTPSLPPGR